MATVLACSHATSRTSSRFVSALTEAARPSAQALTTVCLGRCGRAPALSNSRLLSLEKGGKSFGRIDDPGRIDLGTAFSEFDRKLQSSAAAG